MMGASNGSTGAVLTHDKVISMRKTLKILAAVSLAGSGLLAASPAHAAESDYGQHVVDCAQTMGFDAMHNPGMHEGKSGWDPSHVCSMG